MRIGEFLLALLGILVFGGLTALEIYAFSTETWWHEDGPPKDPRNGI